MPPFFSLTRLTFSPFCHLSPPWCPSREDFSQYARLLKLFVRFLRTYCFHCVHVEIMLEWMTSELVSKCVFVQEREKESREAFTFVKLTRSDLGKVIASYGERRAKHLFFSVFAFACVSVRVPPWCRSAQICCSFSSKSDHTGVSTGSALGKWAACSHPRSSHTKAVPAAPLTSHPDVLVTLWCCQQIH